MKLEILHIMHYIRYMLLVLGADHLVWSPAGVAHLLQGLTCSEMIFCTPISSKPSGQPLIFSIKLPLAGYLLLFGSLSVIPRDGCVGQSQQISSL